MAYDLEEQEQLATFKAWWEKYGNFLLTAVTLVLLAVAAYNGWRWYERREAAQAASIYDVLVRAGQGNDAARVKELAGSIIQNHGRTVFAPMAALHAAKLNHDAGDLAGARALLQWVVDKSGHEEYAAIARVRLAGVLLDEKNFDEALRVIAADVQGPYQVAVLDRRGDILLAQNKPLEARAAWQKALEVAEPQHPLRQLIQLKLESVAEAS